MAGEKLYTEAELERIVKRRVEEANLREWGKGVNGAIEKNTRAVDNLATEIRKHASLPYHPGTKFILDAMQVEGQQIMKEFGIADLNPQQRAMFPLMLKAAVQTENEKEHSRVQSVKRERFWMNAAAYSTVFAFTVTVLALFGVFTFFRTHVLHLPPGP